MKPWRLLAATIACLVLGVHAAAPARIVSLVPAVTEMIFAMGIGGRVVGVSNYDRHPPQVRQIERVGGLLDPDVERILALKPDLVIVYATQVELVQRLDRAAIPVYPYEHRTLADITGTVRAVGARIGSPGPAERLAAGIEERIAGIRNAVAGLPQPRTLLVIGRDASSLRNILASGGYGFLHDMLQAAGGINVFADIGRQSVDASVEMVLARRPEVIVELRYGGSATPAEAARDLAPWNTLASVPAVRNRRVHALVGDRFVVPGPRVADATRELARIIHERR
jgi:iron complex transport system substrate-binding protein